MPAIKDTKTAAYLIYKGKELVKMQKDDLGDYEFVFEEDEEMETLIREYRLTPFKRYLDIYKELITAIKNDQKVG